MECKKCNKQLTGKQTSFCSIKCSKRYHHLDWQKRNRKKVNQVRAKWRTKTNRKSDNAWLKKNRLKHKAHVLLSYHTRSGSIIRKPCEICGDGKSHAHHDDYSKPLQVRWLCATHHRLVHITSLSVPMTP